MGCVNFFQFCIVTSATISELKVLLQYKDTFLGPLWVSTTNPQGQVS